MKALKIILGIVLVLVLAFVIGMFIFPTTLKVERSIEINAPRSLVFEHVNNFAHVNQWSPWTKLDPNMKSEITGEDGTTSAVYAWESDSDDVGKGDQQFTLITVDTVLTHINFYKPFESSADAYLVLEELTPTTTKVTWGFVSDVGRPGNVFMGLMNGAEAIGADYQKGLDSLKAQVEFEMNNKDYGFEIETVEMPETHFAVARDTIAWSALDAYFQTNMTAANKAVSANGKETGTAAGLFFDWDTENQQADLGVGVIYTPAGEIPGYTSVTLSGKALKIMYYGSYQGSGEAHYAIEAYSKDKGLVTTTPAIELYITGPATEPDTSKWLTEIYYLIND